MTQEVVDVLGDLITDYLGLVEDGESSFRPGYKGLYSVKELRVMHTVFRSWRRCVACTVTQIANETGISKTTVSRAVTGLMTNGLLMEEQDPEDGRRRLLRPTLEGQQTLDNINTWLSLWADRLLEVGTQRNEVVAKREVVAEREPSAAEREAIIAPEPVGNTGQLSRDAASR